MELDLWDIPPDPVDVVNELREKGYDDRIRPLDGKKRAFPERGPFRPNMLRHWIGSHLLNIGLLLDGGLVVLDKDGPELGPFRDLESPMRVRTFRGEHHYFLDV